MTGRSGAALPASAFWAGKRVLLTGHTGFKGAWLTCWLRRLGSEIMGVSLDEPPSRPALWEQLAITDVTDQRGDISEEAWVAPASEFDPQVVFHLAAQSLVAVGHREPSRTFRSNVLGTVRVLEALSSFPSVASVVIVTTDKVYEPGPGPFHEGSPLGGREPYAASKAAAELVVASWPSPPAPVVTARAGNVIGGGDWATDRLLPDLVRSWSAGRPVSLRNPQGIRPWQHVLEPLRGYLVLAEAVASGAAMPPALNFGPSGEDLVTVADVVQHAAKVWESLGAMPPDPPSALAAGNGYEETSELVLDSTAAATALDWASLLRWRKAVGMALEWYLGEAAGQPAVDLVENQLSAYTATIEGVS